MGAYFLLDYIGGDQTLDQIDYNSSSYHSLHEEPFVGCVEARFENLRKLIYVYIYIYVEKRVSIIDIYVCP